MSKEDYSREAGGEALAARLRRASDRLDRDGTRVYAAHSVHFEQRWYGILNQLLLNGPMAIGAIAEALRVSHVSVSQASRSLETAGIVESRRVPSDKRRRDLALTPVGVELVDGLAPLWAAFNDVAEELNNEAGDLVALLNQLEDALDRRSMYERIMAKTSGPPPP